MYLIVYKVVEERIEKSVRIELHHMERKHEDRFRTLDRELQEVKALLREQNELLRRGGS
ncbi:hypothetical protein [Saccharibacillus brassicae]|uniref:hypothetical protein n=1 Tax=Saccharibacillus brassicae TaxID=2583377 RepID=UPI00147883C9|nr:hypothetical protein [Saccharibacillus brassicae]